jgi:hypothetical protein
VLEDSNHHEDSGAKGENDFNGSSSGHGDLDCLVVCRRGEVTDGTALTKWRHDDLFRYRYG